MRKGTLAALALALLLLLTACGGSGGYSSYDYAAEAETPHWGIAPASAPANGPTERARSRKASSAPPALDSTASMTR